MSPNKNDTVHISNLVAKKAIASNVVTISSTFQEYVSEYLTRNNIAPLLEFMEKTGMYISEKIETFIHQNELAPHAEFVALINSV